MKIGFISLGCAKNLVDSEAVMGLLLRNGHTLVADPSAAEAIIINTCGFITSAKQESIDTILEMAEYKNNNCRCLIAMGCLVQRYVEQLRQELPEVDRFITIDEYKDITTILSAALDTEIKEYGKTLRAVSTNRWTAYLKIAEGCDNHCRFCAIPLIRGAYRSRPLPDIIEEAKWLAAKGVKELVVIAQDTTRYGSDFDGRYHLAELLEQLNVIEGLHWIRVLYMYPDEISDELIIKMKELDKVLPYFDIPIQHGSDRMLKAMGRRGSIAEIRHTIDLIRKTYDRSALRTTMIVGYPQETEADFDELLAFVNEVRWDRLGAFTYSHEENTPAYRLPDDVPDALKQARLDKLMAQQRKIADLNGEALINAHLEVLIEGYDALRDHYLGRSLYSAPDGVDGTVFVKTPIQLDFGAFYYVVIDASKNHDLYGHLFVQ